MNAERAEYLPDLREDWLRAVVGRSTKTEAVELAEVMSKHTGRSGICEVPRRALMEGAGISRTHVLQRAMRELTRAASSTT